MPTYITAGELAKLADTTKRTIQFYDQKGVLKPAKVNSKQYRFYEEKQVLEYQMILLLSTLGVTLAEIRTYLKRKGNLLQLFNEKKTDIQEQIAQLQFNLTCLNNFSSNLDSNGTMVNPAITTLEPFGVYYIERTGAYAEIGSYCRELADMFENSEVTTMAIFDDQTYRPKQTKIKIGVLAEKTVKLKPGYEDQVTYMHFNPGKVITYTHNGAGSLLSLFWKELEKYCRLNNLKVRKGILNFEIYRKVSTNPSKQFFEIYLPIV